MIGLDFFRQKEKFLLLEVAPGRASGLLISVDGEKNIHPEKFWEEFPFGKLSGSPLKNLRSHKVVVSVHPSSCATISLPVEMEREGGDFDRPIVAAELENMLAKTVGIFFGKCRNGVGQRLGLNEVDVVLVETTANDFKINGHLVINPVGFKGVKIGATLEFVFTTRKIFECLKPFFNSKDSFFFTPSSRAGVFALSRADASPATLIFLDSDSAHYVVFKENLSGRSIREKKMDWSFSRLLESVAAATGTDKRATLDIYSRYIKGDASSGFVRAMGRVIKSDIDLLLGAIKRNKPNGVVYIYSPMPLPFLYPMRLGRSVVKEVQPDNVLDKFGFSLDLREWPAEKSEVFMRLAPFIGLYFDKRDSEINRRLKRRLHWLIQ